MIRIINLPSSTKAKASGNKPPSTRTNSLSFPSKIALLWDETCCPNLICVVLLTHTVRQWSASNWKIFDPIECFYFSMNACSFSTITDITYFLTLASSKNHLPSLTWNATVSFSCTMLFAMGHETVTRTGRRQVDGQRAGRWLRSLSSATQWSVPYKRESRRSWHAMIFVN